MSATLPPSTTRSILPLLDFGFKDTFTIDVGVNRSNIFYHVLPLRHAVTTYRDILQLFNQNYAERGDVPKTLLYVKTRAAAYAVADLLEQHFSRKGLGGIVLPFTFLTSASSKQQILGVLFQPGGVLRILISTEAGGLGIDLRDIQQIVQYLLPGTALELCQHFGRAMRDLARGGNAILMAPSRILIQPGQSGSVSRTTTKLRQDLDTGIKAVTGGERCIRKALSHAARLCPSTVRSLLSDLEPVTGGLAAGNLRCSVAPYSLLRQKHQLATTSCAHDEEAAPPGCCSTCSPDLTIAAFPNFFNAAPSAPAPESECTTTGTRSRAPPAHTAFFPLQTDLAEVLHDLRLSVHRLHIFPNYFPQRAALPEPLVFRLITQTGRLLDECRRSGTTNIEISAIDTLLGTLATQLPDQMREPLSSSLTTWAQTCVQKYPGVLNHISNSGSYLSHPAPRPLPQ
ncbi:hypothetical protein A4X06_0g8870 [Tilletia controversa]|uniref:DNA 3'-5' helicase n=1 Tax=Tilletia controversa TaxID=13291 RepID=A0A8X7MJA6_9BASI|nr:hypothetical protein A4X06_0g8870 [Tilletia controversa]